MADAQNTRDKSRTRELMKIAQSAHTSLTIFDAIAVLCDSHLRGPALHGGRTRNDIRAIQRIALRQRSVMLGVLDAAEGEACG